MSNQRICFTILLIMAMQQSFALVLTSRTTNQNAAPARKLLSFATTAKKQQEYEKLMCKLTSPEEVEHLYV